ncbi:hypothetical protein BH24ACI3_BH24ACI3_11750 [soil metagenome]
MQRSEKLKHARNLLLKLHKTLLDHERAIYEGIHGPKRPTEFLTILLEDPDFSWLRKFSVLIVDIDEMFAQKDGYSEETVEVHLTKLRELIQMKDEDETFRAKYQAALQQDLDAATRQGELHALFEN